MSKKSFEKYLSRRTKITENLTKKLDQKNKGFQEEEGFWRPTTDKTKNGWAIIRFLPPGGDEEDPYIHYYEYSFQGPGGWYIEKSRTSLGKDEPDPCHEFVQKLWNAKDEKNARKYPRMQRYISNILVVKDPEHPENEGKVFKFRYGTQIQQKIEEALKPQIPDDPAIDAFDMLEGANFKLIVGRKDKFATYENSKFDAPSKISDKTERMGEILEQCYPLAHYVAPESFKSYEALKMKLERVLGKATLNQKPRAMVEDEDEPTLDVEDDILEGSDVENEDLDSILKDL